MKIQQRERESNQPPTSYSKESYSHLISFTECDSYLWATWSKDLINKSRNAMVLTDCEMQKSSRLKGPSIINFQSGRAQYSSYLCHKNGLVQIDEYKAYQFDFPALFMKSGRIFCQVVVSPISLILYNLYIQNKGNVSILSLSILSCSVMSDFL